MKIIICLIISFYTLIAKELYASFNVEALNQSKLSLESIGIVKEIKVKISDHVKKGDVLLSLDTSKEEIALQNAQNDYKLALAKFNNIKSKMTKFTQVQNFIDKQSYEDIKTEFNIANLELQKAKINIAYYKNLIDKKILKAPYDGIISDKTIQVGEGVAGVNQILFKIFSYPEVKLILSFDEKYKDEVKLNQEFIYKIEGKEQTFKGKISLIYPSIDIKTRKIYAEAKAQNLTPGLFGEGKIIIKD
ncbi:efflux RND transporter periplasmic adaptor subunit [Campylobacter novaezeelandiae]|uniref:Efflux RND transporter periplasmic adaptor subunit n=1 Tax=Campylobacter novaezeelandiae TaxID=2267891 RepID=A0A4Q9JXF5_9BACT|nr:efflux RND transporter periplasmic adaptor subunit [Campylobacter novaezeelandiae]QWU80127.1 multidrug efflux system CmeDEF, membrane fusion component CmeE [Campylobacter novaezeelandiae]TBR78958.1 efflux RND transporter periplasmic adaptor subunit [Campylobacter novaezeelandiae]TBR82300.1 efflux RND transporter periplasmic adaptor subunit [Campylobacter novaezeelandiae]